MRGELIIEERVDGARALGIGAALLAEPSDVVRLYGAGLAGDATALGAFQRRTGEAALRRSTGGPSTPLDDGVVYFALGLPHASALMDCPRDRVLNRNVRGFLTGLSRGGAPALYFGRDTITVARQPIAFLAWTRAATGAVLLEVFVRDESARSTVERVAVGHERRFGVSWSTREPPCPRQAREPDWDARLRWSGPHAVAIGSIEAGVHLEDDRIAAAALAGDFFADADAPAALAAKLAGAPATPDAIGAAIDAAIDATFGRTGTHVIEGIADLTTLRTAFLAAAAQT